MLRDALLIQGKTVSDPTVSVIIPAYRAAHTINRAIDSPLTQTRLPDEVLVVDDGSPDDLAAPLSRYGERVRLIRKPNGGAASPRNLGIERSRGELVVSGPVFIQVEPSATRVLEPGSLSRSSLDVDCGNMLRVVRRNASLVGPRGLRFWEAQPFGRWARNHLARETPPCTQVRPGPFAPPAALARGLANTLEERRGVSRHGRTSSRSQLQSGTSSK